MTTVGAAVVPPSTFKIFPVGTPITGALPGDLMLVRHGTLMAKLIRLGQRIRYRGDLRKYAWTNHAAIVVSKTQLIEQQGSGGTLVDLATYIYEDVAIVHVNWSPDQIVDITDFAYWTLGLGYGWLSIVAIVWDLLTGFHLSFGSGLRMICSAAASRALEHGGTYIPDRLPEAVMPADLSRYFQISLPSVPAPSPTANVTVTL